MGPNLLEVFYSSRPLLFPLFLEKRLSRLNSSILTLLPTIPAKLNLLYPRLKFPSKSLGPKFFLMLLLPDFLLPLFDLLFPLASLLDLDSVFFEVTFSLNDYLILPNTPERASAARSLFGLGVEFNGLLLTWSWFIELYSSWRFLSRITSDFG